MSYHDDLIWNPVFLTGKLDENIFQPEDKGSDRAKIIACVEALKAWTNCMRHHAPPKNFGWGMHALIEWAQLKPIDIIEGNAEKVAADAEARMKKNAANLVSIAISRMLSGELT